MQLKPITAIAVTLLVVASLLVAGCSGSSSNRTYSPEELDQPTPFVPRFEADIWWNDARDLGGDVIPKTLTFKDISESNISNITKWSWDFGDGKTSTEMDPGEHLYPAYGYYNVTLTVTDDKGNTATTHLNVYTFEERPSPTPIAVNNEGAKVEARVIDRKFTPNKTYENVTVRLINHGPNNLTLSNITFYEKNESGTSNEVKWQYKVTAYTRANSTIRTVTNFATGKTEEVLLPGGEIVLWYRFGWPESEWPDTLQYYDGQGLKNVTIN